MTYQDDFTLPAEIMEQLATGGMAYLPELIQTLVNTAMQLERQKYLGAARYEHNPERVGHANGYKPKTVKTRMGEVRFDVPQVREGGFYPHALEKGLRSERALTLTLAEMYVQGVSTRKVAAVVEQLCGCEVSSSQVSRAAALLDEKLEAWRNSELGEIVYLLLDARYEKVRQDGRIRDVAVLVAAGINREGHRQVLGVSVSMSEQEVHWRTFLESLVKRGLRGVELIISDDHSGLKAARLAVFGGVPWQRCQFHLQQNAQAYVPRKEMQTEVAEDIRMIFNAPNRVRAEEYLRATVLKYEKTASKLAVWMEQNIPEGLTVFSFPSAHQRRIRTTNGLERLNREIRRRTGVVSIFPNESAALRLISAILLEISDEWEGGKLYLTFEDGGRSRSSCG
jgi:transposase-like protein